MKLPVIDGPDEFTLVERPNEDAAARVPLHRDIWPADRLGYHRYHHRVDSSGNSNMPNRHCPPIAYKRHEYGRYFPADSYVKSATVMWRRARAAIFHEGDIDIDIVNCHPKLLLWLMTEKAKEGDTPAFDALATYCESRDDLILQCRIENLQSINAANKTDYALKDFIKQLCIMVMYGGSIESWAKDNHLDMADVHLHADIEAFVTQMSHICHYVAALPEFEELVTWNAEHYSKRHDGQEAHAGCHMSRIMQHFETAIITDAMNVAVFQLNLSVTVYAYDGFQISKPKTQDTAGKWHIDSKRVQQLLEELNKLHPACVFVDKAFACP